MELDVMLCDHAQVAGNKLFISGANIDRTFVPAGTPPPYLVNVAAAGTVRVPWMATNADHTLNFRLVTEDEQTPELAAGVEPGPDGIGADMRFNVGRPPQLSGGEEQLVPFAFNLQGLPLALPGRYIFVFSVDGSPMRRLSFTISIETIMNRFGPSSLAR